MGADSKIEWTDHTFNPWVGCTKISPGCDHCYAEGWAKRSGLVKWGGERRRTSAQNWKQPLKWHASIPDGQRRRVFCASLADVFDNQVPDDWRFDLFELIRKTPRLDWLLLTKRVGNAKLMLLQSGMDGAYNIWIGATVVTQEEADRDIPKLLRVPARIRFLSCEPLLGPINLDSRLLQFLDWVIVGGESGPGARPFVLGWGKDIVRQCNAAGVAVFVKQVGANPVNREGERCPHIHDRKGKVMEEWPEVLRVREFPTI